MIGTHARPWQTATAARSRVRGARAAILVALLMLVVATGLTYPVVLETGRSLPGLRDFDEFEYAWLIWWYDAALLDRGQDPANLPFYYPMQAQQPLVTLTPLGWLLPLPLVLMLGAPAAYTVYWLLNFALCGLAGYLLAMWLARSRCAAILAGLVFAFYPGKMLHGLGHFGDLMVYMQPLYVFFLLRLLRRPGRRNALLLGLVTVIGSAIDFRHIALFYLPFTVVFVAYHLLFARRAVLDPRFLTSAAASAIGTALATLPLFGPFVLSSIGGQLGHLKEGGLEASSADLLSFLLPPMTHPVLGRLPFLKDVMQTVWNESIYIETCLYLGVVAVVLGVIALRRRRDAGLWVAVIGVAAVLALGPSLKVGGHVTGVPLPYCCLNRLPFYEWVRIPGRMDMMLKLALAMLAALGAATWLAKRTPPRRALLSVGLGGLILFEYLTFAPYPTVDVTPSQFLVDLAGDGQRYGVLTLASHEYAQYLQTLHQHDIVEGHIHRWPPGGSEWALQLHGLALFPPSSERPYWDVLDETLPYGRAGASLFSAGLDLSPARVLAEHGIRYVVYDRQGPWTVNDRERYGAQLRGYFGEPIHVDQRLDVFEIRPVRPGVPSLSPGAGWYALEGNDRELWRWTGDVADLQVSGLQPGRYRLRLAVRADPERQLRVSIDDRVLIERQIDKRVESASAPFALGPDATLRLALDGCRAPFDPLRGDFDRRCLGVAVSEARLFPALEPTPNWGGQVSLLGYELAQGVGVDSALYVRLYWQAIGPVAADYTAFVHALDKQGRRIGQVDVLLEDRRQRAARFWPAGSSAVSLLRLEGAGAAVALKIGLYDLQTMERLPLQGDVSGENALLVDVK